MSYATKEQLQSLMADIASKVHIPTIGVGGGYAPIGTIIAYMGTTAPQDYLACDGSTYNIADYSQLANFIEAQFGSKNYFGGDGITTFGVPDLRGEFLRGTGTNSHENQGSGANVGEHQDATEIVRISVGNNVNLYGTPSINNEDSSVGKNVKNKAVALTSGAQENTPLYTTRPTNTSVLYCIKAVVAGDVYSTEERVVGTWIDGKPIYQKTFSLEGEFKGSDLVIYSFTDWDMDKVINLWGNSNTDIDFHPLTNSHPTSSACKTCYVQNKSLKIITGSSARYNNPIFTIQYTKTTD